MTFPSIRLEGTILSPDLLDAITREDKHSQKPTHFGLESGTKVKDDIASTWATAKALWTAYQSKLESLRPGSTGTTETRNLFISPLLALLGYQPQLSEAETVHGKSYAISHRDATRDNLPLHIIGPFHADASISPDKSSLDVKVKGMSRMSPHALVQEYLNLTEHLYALVTNGHKLRLLRDSSRLIKLSFLEFDFERIFEDELFSDFALLYRLLHASRMPVTQDDASESIIEQYHQDSLEDGSAIRKGLGAAVEEVIVQLANGFLNHPANNKLREAAAANQFPIHSLATERSFSGPFYQALLRLIYRLLFLLVTEERGLIQARSTDRKKIRIYRDYYSLTRLRRLAESIRFLDARHTDAWQSLLRCFQLFEPGGKGKPLGVHPLGGLFDRDALGLLSRCQLDNHTLLRCLRKLSLFQHPETGNLMRVNYAALNVEEFGSVYEGLLEYDPAVTEINSEQWQFQFVKGDARSSSGSHYTPDELVQPLIKHSLDHLIRDRLKDPDPEKALLSLTVCDVACGSGHILLSAARRIGTELAILRTGEDQPSPPALREAIRDVIRNCIYGVDLNPLAVELCKVALWLEAHVPGEPLNFLDHRIKCGNAIVGVARQEELQRGIPDEAFKTLPGDDKDTAAALRKQNKEERKGHQELPWAQTRQDDLAALQSELAEITALPESTPEEIHHKQERYDAYEHGEHLRNLKTLADLQVAQFYLPKTERDRNKITTHDQYRKYLRGENFHPEPTAAAQAIANRKGFFHWFIQFPAVFQLGGFNCILGNPPYLGNRKLKGTYGEEFLDYIRFEYSPAGAVDLVTYFVRRIYSLLVERGFQAIITTNTVSQGAARKGGLEFILQRAGFINFAIPSMEWPGRAAVHVMLLSIHKGPWKKAAILGTNEVELISAHIDDSAGVRDPYPLGANRSKSFQGSVLVGKGFILTEDEGRKVLAMDSRNHEVVFPYLNGENLNNLPSQHPRKMAISFFDRSEADAREYKEPYQIVEERVKPERTRKDDEGNFKLRKPLPQKWWIYGDKRPELYRLIRNFDRVLVHTIVTKTHGFSWVENGMVYPHSLVVFALEDDSSFTTLQSTIHEIWAWRYSSTMKTDRRYVPTKCFDSFPFPEEPTPSDLAPSGSQYHEHRRDLMQLMQLGLTKTYNLFHARELKEGAVAKASKQGPEVAAQAYQDLLTLRHLHRQMDEAVLAAYGWHQDTDDWGPAIALRHDFYDVDYLPENDRVRYTIHPDARKELLKRLLKLNHQRHAEEVAAGLHDKKSNKKAAKKKVAQRKKSDDELL